MAKTKTTMTNAEKKAALAKQKQSKEIKVNLAFVRFFSLIA